MYISYLIFLKKFKKIYLYKTCNNEITCTNHILFLKKAHLYFKDNFFSFKLIKSKTIKIQPDKRVRGKKKNVYKSFQMIKSTTNKDKLLDNNIKFFKLKENFLRGVRSNTKNLKLLLFKKKLKKKQINEVFKNLEENRKNIQHINPLHNTIVLLLLQSQLIFSHEDLKFFLAKGLIFLNGAPCTQPLIKLKVGDRVQLPLSLNYYMYVANVLNFFKKKIKYMKYKKWRFKQTKAKISYKKWNPKFLKFFFFYRLNTPDTLEVDLSILSFIVVKNTNNPVKINTSVMRIFNTYFSKSYRWKKIT